MPMFTNLKKYFIAPQYEGNPEKSQDARTTHRVAIALLGLGIFSVPFIFQLESPIREYALYGTLSGMFIWLFTIGLVKWEQTNTAKVIILAINSFNLLAVTFATGGFSRPTIMTSLFLLALANLLFPKRGAQNYGIILLALGTVLFSLHWTGLVPAPTIPSSEQSTYLLFNFTLISVTVVLSIASTNARRNLEQIRESESELKQRNIELNQLKEELEVRVEQRTQELQGRTDQLEAIADLARSIATIQEVDQLLPQITNLVSERFGFYHVGILLLDETKKFAVLRAANSEGGKQMIARGHRLAVGQQGIVGYVTDRGQARVALDVGEEAVYFNNPELPETHSEVALPLRIGQDIIGALDIQSRERNAFSQEDVEIFSVLADQVSVAIQNAQSLEQAQRALHEADLANSQLTGQAWAFYKQSKKVKGIHFDGSSSRSIEDTVNKSPQDALTVPVLIRGQEVSKLILEAPEPGYEWSEDDIAIAHAAAERVALALENARLLEDAQRRAAKERAISESTARVGTALDIEGVLNVTAEELERALGSSEVIIQLGSEK